MSESDRESGSVTEADCVPHALIELAPEIIALLDRDGVVKYVSPAVEQVTGYRPDELIGKRFDEILHADDLQSLNEVFARLLVTRDVVTAQNRFKQKSGSWITLETVARNYFDRPDVEGILICSRDITRHVEIQQTLRRSADESAALFEDAPCGYHAVDAAGVYVRVNAAELRWLQRTREELVGKVRFTDLLTVPSRATCSEAFADLKKKHAARDLELEVVRKDGTTFSALLQSVPVFDDQDRFVEARTTVYDITERKRAERALVKVNRALRVLSRASREIILADTESALLSAVCSVLIEHGGYRLAAVHYVQHDAEATMKLAAKAGALHHDVDNVAVTWADTAQGQGPIGRAVRTGRPQVNQQVLTDPRMAPWREFGLRAGVHSLMSLPLKDATGVFATLSVFAAEPDAFDIEEVRLLDELASDLSFGIGSLLADRFASEHVELKRPAGETEEPEPLARLSPREREVLKLVAEGRSSKEIAMLFGVAPTSVGTYRSRIMFKLHVDDVTGLVRFAIRHGVIHA